MNQLTIRTNNQVRPIVYGFELTLKERDQFDYLNDEEFAGRDFVRYKGQLYDTHEFMRIEPQTMREHGTESPLKDWDGYMSDSYFSGVLIRYSKDSEGVIMGRYFS